MYRKKQHSIKIKTKHFYSMAQLTTDDYISLYASPGTNNSTYILLNYTSDGERKIQNFLKCSARDVVFQAERKF